jgi:hypothetical protein
MIQIKVEGTSMIIHYTKLSFVSRNISLVVCIKQNINFKFQPGHTFICFIFT